MIVNDITVKSYEQAGFSPQIFFGGWRVAILNHQASQVRGQVPFVERHHETDEVFVLLSGSASLLSAGYGDIPGELQELKLEPGLIYNVPLNLWHATITEPGAKLLIVENAVTDERNSSYYNI